VEDSPAAPERRRYNSPLRRERAADTRARILSAGSELVHGYPSWDWRNLTFRAVAERAGVSERTVYRHFTTEQQLHRAVMRRLEEEAGVSYDGIRLEDVAAVTERVFAAAPSFSVAPSHVEPHMAEEDRHRRESLLAAVSADAPEWSETEQEMAAAILDVMWAGAAHERLTTIWSLDLANATQAAAWAISLVRGAIRDGQRPTIAQIPSGTRGGRRSASSKKASREQG
jgi:AcrR family transcriptional regulator